MGGDVSFLKSGVGGGGGRIQVYYRQEGTNEVKLLNHQKGLKRLKLDPKVH